MTLIRSVLFVVWMYGLMVIMAIVCAPSLLGPRSWARACLHVWLKLVMGGLRVLCGVSFEVRGREHIPAGGALVASKHQSMFDTLAPWIILADPCIILKKSLAHLPFFGWYAVKLKNIPIDRGGGAQTIKSMAAIAEQRAAQGRQILIFPEGTRAEPGAPPDYKPGVAMLYRQLNVPCTPVALNSGLHWPPSGLRRHPGTIVIEFLPAIEPGLKRADFQKRLEAAIETASNRLLAHADAPAKSARLVPPEGDNAAPELNATTPQPSPPTTEKVS